MNTTEQPVAIVTGASSGLTVPDTFPAFSLTRLLRTVFYPKVGEKVAILIDLDDPHQVKNFAFLKNPDLTIQRQAYEVFYQINVTQVRMRRNGKTEILIEDFVPAAYMGGY